MTRRHHALVVTAGAQAGVRLDLQFAENPPYIWCDRTMVGQVLLNLVHNAMQAMDFAHVSERQVSLRAAPDQASDGRAARFFIAALPRTSRLRRRRQDKVVQPTTNACVFIVDDDASVRAALAWLLRLRHLPSVIERRLGELTERALAVMRLVVDGKPNNRVAGELQISVRTVEVHRDRVFQKMQVKSAVELANLLQWR